MNIKQDISNTLIQAAIKSPFIIMITDQEGYIQFVNDTLCKISGYTSSELIGKKTSIFKSGKHKESYYASLWQTIQNNGQWKGSLINKDKEGHFYQESASISIIKNDADTPLGFIKIASVVDDDVLQLSAISRHDANQPLSAILSNAESGIILLNQEKTDYNEIKEIFLDIIHENKRLINILKK